MRIMVMGAGAVGGYYGAVLSRAGMDVTFIARGEGLAAIRGSGLRVESVTSGSFMVHPAAFERPEEAEVPDLVLFCVKGYDNAAAIELLRPAVGESTTVLTLQNGIGSADELGAALGHEKVLLGATYVDAVRLEPGVVREDGGPCNIVFGEEDGSRSDRAVAVLDALQGAGIAVELSDDMPKSLWTKLTYICGLSGMTCITRSGFPEVLDTPATRAMTLTVMREVVAVAEARGIRLGDGFADEVLAQFVEARGEMMSSMYNDLQSGNPLEVSVLNGAVSRIGKEAGVPTPANDFITACLTPAHNRAVQARQAG